MKHRLRHVLGLSALAAGLVVPLASQPADAAPTSYTIYCRGGQGMTEFSIAHAGAVVEKQFLHGNAAYDADSLNPGTCAWPDRAMRADEPYRLSYGHPLEGRDRLTVRGNMQLGLWRFGSRMIIEQETPEDLDAINKLQDPNFIVELRVRAESFKKRSRGGHTRTVNVLSVTDTGVVRQIGESNRG